MNKIEILNKILNTDFAFSGNVSMDSRNLNKGDIFFAINTGNNYIEMANEKGAFVIYDDSLKDISNSKKVDNTVKFMQEMANVYRDYFKFPVIAITGSNGKTTAKDILASILDANKTMGNYNNHIGVPYTILSCPIDAKYLVLEMGMSAPLEIDLLASIAKPDYSIIVNIGDSHLEFFKDRNDIFKAKCELIPYTKKIVVVNGEDEYLKTLELDNVLKINISDIRLNDFGTSFIYDNERYSINLYGKHNAIDAALGLAVAKLLGVNVSKEKLNNLKLTKMRFELIEKCNNLYINDAYNASPISVKSSLLTLNQIFKNKRKIIILGDMLELGENEIKYHKDLKDILENIDYDKLYLYGNLMSNIEIDDAIKTNNKNEIIEDLRKEQNSIIYLKGSRGMKLEEIIGSDV
ncbi:UDP-N-acetylmuramoyl-tripeptide--D-alanyl-D-alanine ligase [Oceanivirga salmonicida]|uniref:UDP-N-acetylmuramoyl-tripeptide--D-alanyl-D- alanine ligase n=1 Tax=Oceanivirga salmonicida TaxID=1769291 RepID=UPI0008314FBB|nr:UDP-N-acetylmuramoyl-tripeptide--D-alanyl-D-alanine ligase [Oceanivirga salmonicida]